MTFRARPLYGIGYAPIGDLIDVVDPLDLRAIPGAIGRRVDAAIDARTQRAGRIVGAKVEAGVRHAMDDAERTAVYVMAGAAVGVALFGGSLLWFRSQGSRKEPDR